MDCRTLRSIAALSAAIACAGCAAGASDLQQAQIACAGDRGSYRHLEVYVPRATVTRVLGFRSTRSGMHEGFLFTAAGSPSNVLVEDNTDITGPIPLHRGQTISLLGQYECSDGVIHWTHRDPAGRHVSGYIEANGQRYQ